MAHEWICPFCDKGSIVTDANSYAGRVWFGKDNVHGKRVIEINFTVCANPKCREFTLVASMSEYRSVGGGSTTVGKQVEYWPLIPASNAKSFPDYVPTPILDDYYEACLVRDLSPKASATLSRRCLQGMIRDFWKIKRDRLIDEITELKGRVDPLTWDAIDTVRNVGNIGAHMEKDINVILDVDSGEASKLIGLIELLIRDWYVLRYERQSRLNDIIDIGKAKRQLKDDRNFTSEPPRNTPEPG
jgi:hypothetical protein